MLSGRWLPEVATPARPSECVRRYSSMLACVRQDGLCRPEHERCVEPFPFNDDIIGADRSRDGRAFDRPLEAGVASVGHVRCVKARPVAICPSQPQSAPPFQVTQSVAASSVGQARRFSLHSPAMTGTLRLPRKERASRPASSTPAVAFSASYGRRA